MIWLCTLPALIFLVRACVSVPLTPSLVSNVPSETANPKGPSSVQVINFLQKFGYLESGDPSSSALFTETAVTEAIKNMQYFGGLNQTGQLDNSTVKLLATPRCGVRDVMRKTLRRRKRFVVGGEGWKKRLISYHLSNWYPDVGEHPMKTSLRKAFAAWEKYSGLRFVEEGYSSADIRIFFAPGAHLDGYPFDGPGGVLAHAFYPYEMDDYGGDIHFDYDEPWTLEETTGMNFFDVAIHEIGHSLGLAHSNVPDSVMFAYYTGKRETEHLSEDDVRALYHLYITRPLDDTDYQRYFGSKVTDTDTEAPPPTPEDPRDPTDEDEEVHIEEEETQQDLSTTTEKIITYEGDSETVDDMKKRIKENCKVFDLCEDDEAVEVIPDLCEGHYDAVGVYRQEIFVFKGKYLWRFTRKNDLEPGYPVPFRQLFYQLPLSIQKIDATYERPTDHNIIFFTGKQYWVHNGNYFVENSPQPISNLGLPESLERINGVMVWGKNSHTYLFGSDEYWKYDEERKQIVEGYPKVMQNWRQVPENIDAVETFDKGETYFFKDNLCYKFDDDRILVNPKYPLPAPQVLFGCKETTK